MLVPPPFTVAIPTYNGADHIDEAICGVLAQEGVPFDVLISDDRSEDDTLERIRRRAGDRARIDVNSERLGLAGNWNRCVERSRTPFVAIVHQDDVIFPHHLARHLAAYRAATGMVASNAEAIDAEGRSLSPARVEPGGCGPEDRRYEPGAFLHELAVQNPLRCSAVTIRAEAHAAVGGFDPSFRYAVDWDFWIRMAECREVAWLGATTAAFRWHPASETHRFAVAADDLEEIARLVSQLYDHHPELRDARGRAERRLARAYLHRAYQAARARRGGLVKTCLSRARVLDPGIVREIVRDPRLALRLAGAIFGSPRSET